jgi:transcriptional regulator with XRE-family HTH domain
MELETVMWRLSRAARELLGWTQAQAAEAARISESGLKKYEGRKSQSIGMLNTLRRTYEEAGIEFILSDQPGVARLGVVLTAENDEFQVPPDAKTPAKKPTNKAAKTAK